MPNEKQFGFIKRAILHLCESNMRKRKMLKVLFGATIISSITLLVHLGINFQIVKKLKEKEDTKTIILDDVNHKLKTPITLPIWVPLKKKQSISKLKKTEDTIPITLDDLYISVKTTHHNYNSRMPIILKTWVTLAKEQTWFFTDDDNEEFQIMTDGHAINTKCPPSHDLYDLHCKMGVELNTYMTTNKTWFCHFDDDNYVNVPILLELLQEYDRQSEWYLGKRSVDSIEATVKKEKKKVRVHFGTGGAGICISRPLMMRMKPFTIGNKFVTIAESLSEGDDVVVGYIIEHLLNVSFTEVEQFHSHYENHKKFKLETIDEQVSWSYDGGNAIQIEGFDKESDPTRFISLHCGLYPKADICSEMKRPKIF